jgi:hypothetical protein
VSNLRIWDKVKQPDTRYVKDFQRKGGFSGKAINGTYNHLQATQVFGPMGLGWGVDVLDERYVEGAPILAKDDKGKLLLDSQGFPVVLGHEKVHVVYIRLWYLDPETGQRGEVYNFGQTYFVEDTARGPKTDEEAPKKSLTDAVSKALSNLGFNAEIHLGLWDDNKYVAQVKAEQEKRRKEEASRAQALAESADRVIAMPPSTPTASPAAAQPEAEPEPPAKAEAQPVEVTFSDVLAAYNALSPALKNQVTAKFLAIAKRHGKERLGDAGPEAWAEALAVVKELAA